MLKKFTFVCTLAAAFVLLTSAKPSPVKAFDQAVSSIVKDMEVVGLSTSVVSGNKIIYSQSFGLANTDTNEPMSGDIYFRAGLAGRFLIPMAVYQCYDNGLLKLTDDVSTYIGFKLRNPNYPDIPITINQLLHQNSSLMDAKEWKSLDDLKNPELEDLWNDAKPGAKFKKCSKGFIILAAIVEKVSGVSFEEYAQAYLFQPLKITASYTPADFKDNRAISYNYKDGEYKKSTTVYKKKKNEEYKLVESVFSAGTTSLLMITPSDMAKIILTVINEGECPMTKTRLYSKDASDKFLKPNKANTRCGGIGITTKAVEGTSIYYTSGIHNGTYVYVAFEPVSKVGFCAFCNGANNKDFSKEIFKAFTSSFFE